MQSGFKMDLAWCIFSDTVLPSGGCTLPAFMDTGITAAVYEGEMAEQKWREDTSRYSELRHPKLLQLSAVVNSGVHAAILHNDLIPYI